jgi:hypothetical protein
LWEKQKKLLVVSDWWSICTYTPKCLNLKKYWLPVSDLQNGFWQKWQWPLISACSGQDQGQWYW